MDAVMYDQFLAVERSHWWFRARREILLGVVRGLAPAGAPVLEPEAVAVADAVAVATVVGVDEALGADVAVAEAAEAERPIQGITLRRNGKNYHLRSVTIFAYLCNSHSK
jgi:hypothetical protein